MVGAMRVIDRVAAALAGACDELLLIANVPGAEAWLPGVRVAPDVYRDRGSLGGVHAALVRAAGPVLVVAWDMPFVTTALLRALRVLGDEADAAVPESDARHGLEPLCAYYAPTCLTSIERRLDAGDLRAAGFLDDVRLARMPASAVAAFGDPARLFFNLNGPDDLSRARELASLETCRADPRTSSRA